MRLRPAVFGLFVVLVGVGDLKSGNCVVCNGWGAEFARIGFRPLEINFRALSLFVFVRMQSSWGLFKSYLTFFQESKCTRLRSTICWVGVSVSGSFFLGG